MFYELIDVVFIERLRDLTSGIWLSLVNISSVLQIFPWVPMNFPQFNINCETVIAGKN